MKTRLRFIPLVGALALVAWGAAMMLNTKANAILWPNQSVGGGSPTGSPTPIPSNSYNWLNILDFPGADICAQFNAASAFAILNHVPNIVWPSGNYVATTQCQAGPVLTDTIADNAGEFNVWAYGVTLRTTGVLDGIIWKVQANGIHSSLYGLKVIADNAQQLAGFHIEGAFAGACTDCQYIYTNPGTAGANQMGVEVSNFTAGTDAITTQTFVFNKTKLSGLSHDSGGANRVPVGLRVEGVSNGVIFRDGIITGFGSQGGSGVVISDDPAGTSGNFPDNVLIDKNDLEGNLGGAVSFRVLSGHQAQQGIGRVQITNNDFDGDTTVLDLTNAPANGFFAPVFLAGNMVVPNNNQYLKNPQGFPVDSLDDLGYGAGAFPGPSWTGGMNFDALSLKGAGIAGGGPITQIQPPTMTIRSFCTVSGGETCSTQRCYRMTAVDYQGNETQPDSGGCTATTPGLGGPDTLNSTNYVQLMVNPSPVLNHGKAAAGWRVYGRALNNNLFMDPTGKTVTGSVTHLVTPVSILNTDPSLAPFASQIGPTFNDDGTITPSGAMPTANTTGILYPSAAGLGSVLVPPYTFANLPTFAHTVLTGTSMGTPGGYWRMDDASGNLVDSSGNSNTATPTAGPVTFGSAGSITDDADTAITWPGSGHPYFTVASAGTLPSGSNLCWTGAIKKAATGSTGQFFSQKTGGLTVGITAGNALYVAQSGGPVMATSAVVADTAWHYITVSVNTGTPTIYYDGAPLTFNVVPATLTPADATLYLGILATLTSGDWPGSTDEFAIWSAPCTAMDATILYGAWIARKNGQKAYDTTDGCSTEYTANAWGDFECGSRKVNALPSCTTDLTGARATANDTNATCASVGFGNPPTGGGGSPCPVFCNGAAWLEGG